MMALKRKINFRLLNIDRNLLYLHSTNNKNGNGLEDSFKFLASFYFI